jgi:hypothetical protein
MLPFHCFGPDRRSSVFVFPLHWDFIYSACCRPPILGLLSPMECSGYPRWNTPMESNIPRYLVWRTSQSSYRLIAFQFDPPDDRSSPVPLRLTFFVIGTRRLWVLAAVTWQPWWGAQDPFPPFFLRATDSAQFGFSSLLSPIPIGLQLMG